MRIERPDGSEGRGIAVWNPQYYRGLLRDRNTLLEASGSPLPAIWPAGLNAIRLRSRTGDILLVSRIPGRTTSDHAPRNTAPFGNLAIFGAHPVHWIGRLSPLFAVSGEA